MFGRKMMQHTGNHFEPQRKAWRNKWKGFEKFAI